MMPVLFQDDFESSVFTTVASPPSATLSGWDVVAYGGGNSVFLNSDPAFAQSGMKSIGFHYTINPGSASSEDRNWMISKHFASPGYDWVLISGYVRLGPPTLDNPNVQRKLFYLKDPGYPSGWAAVLTSFDRQLAFAGAGGDNTLSWNLAMLDWNRWYKLDFEVKANTPGASDGWIKVWVDNVQVLNRQNFNARSSLTTGLNRFEVGTQVNRTNFSNVDELRYWDNVAILQGEAGPYLGGAPPPPPPPSNFARPISDVLNQLDSPTLWDRIDEVTPSYGTDVERIRSGYGNGAQSGEVKLSPAVLGTGYIVRVLAWQGLAGNSLTYELRQGTAIIASRQHPLPVGQASATTDMLTLTPTEASQITDSTDLRIRFVVNAATERALIGWAELEVQSGGDTTPPTIPQSLTVLNAQWSGTMWTVNVQAPRVIDTDLNKYKFYRGGVFDGEVVVGALNPIPYTYSIAADGTYSLTCSAVDLAGNESAQSVPTNLTLDHLAPSVPGSVIVVGMAWS